MKVSVSLPPADVEFLDEYLHRRGAPSRSAAVQQAIDLLRRRDLEDAYTAAWADQAGESADDWDQTTADGLADAAR